MWFGITILGGIRCTEIMKKYPTCFLGFIRLLACVIALITLISCVDSNLVFGTWMGYFCSAIDVSVKLRKHKKHTHDA